jgi:hypothetical protein
MIKLSEEGRHAESWDRLKALVPKSQVVNTKEKFLKEIKSASPMNEWMIKWNQLTWCGDIFSLDRKMKLATTF